MTCKYCSGKSSKITNEKYCPKCGEAQTRTEKLKIQAKIAVKHMVRDAGSVLGRMAHNSSDYYGLTTGNHEQTGNQHNEQREPIKKKGTADKIQDIAFSARRISNNMAADSPNIFAMNRGQGGMFEGPFGQSQDSSQSKKGREKGKKKEQQIPDWNFMDY